MLVNLVLGSIAFKRNANYKHSVNARFFVRDTDINLMSNVLKRRFTSRDRGDTIYTSPSCKEFNRHHEIGNPKHTQNPASVEITIRHWTRGSWGFQTSPEE